MIFLSSKYLILLSSWIILLADYAVFFAFTLGLVYGNF